jgi:hypothetical protein
MDNRTETSAIETRAEPEHVFAILNNPARIPEWAPDFAESVTLYDENFWRARKGGNEFVLQVDASPASGTVDYLRHIDDGRLGGAYIRVFPNPGGGGVVTMTIPALATDQNRTRALLDAELCHLVTLALKTTPEPNKSLHSATSSASSTGNLCNHRFELGV